MDLPIKFLKQNGQPFLPVTSAEAVVVNHATGVKRLDEVLRFKVEEVITPVGSGLTSYRQNQGVIIVHSNTIEPSTEEFKPKLIKYDNRGHIVDTQDFQKIKISIQDIPYTEYNGSAESLVKFGDDFMDSEGYIQIRWNTLT